MELILGGIEENSDNRTREYAFTQADFDRIRKLIYQHAGISLSTGKKNMVYSRLARRVRASGLNSFHEYLNFLERGNPEEWEAFTNALTTNLTAFFANNITFRFLRNM